MANPQKVGIFISDEKIVLADTIRGKIQTIVSAPFISSLGLLKEQSGIDVNDEVQMVGFFQKLLRENKIEINQAAVSIPTKEVFLRSFVIPYMPANEINNVIFFEAKKYVPFELKLLDYAYKAIPFIENKQKRLRIIFYGVRKQTVYKYDRILKQVSFKTVTYEPSLVSLAKQLIIKKYLRRDQKMVVVYVHDNYGQIVFYEKGVSFFFREFPLAVAEAHDSKAVADVIRAQLLREIRKSFEFYNRQFSPEKIKEILVLSTELDKELIDSCSEELSVKARVVESLVTVGLQRYPDMDTICASGSCMIDKDISFNFTDNKGPAAVSDPRKPLPWYVTELLSWDISEFKYAIQASVVCALLLGAGYLHYQFQLEDLKRRNENLVLFQGPKARETVEQLKQDIKSNAEKLEKYKKILLPSQMSSLLVSITNALPKGVWLSDANIDYSNDRVSLSLSGSVYRDDMGSEYKSINQFLANLKESKVLNKVKLKSDKMSSQQEGKYKVVVFAVTGS